MRTLEDLIKDNLGDHKISPPDRMWDVVEKKIEAKPKRIKLPVQNWIGYAAALVLVSIAGFAYFLTDQNHKEGVFSRYEYYKPIHTDVLRPSENDELYSLNNMKSLQEAYRKLGM